MGSTALYRAVNGFIKEDSVSREIDGISLEMARLPGETDDQICVGFRRKGFCAAVTITMAVFPTLRHPGRTVPRPIGLEESIDALLCLSCGLAFSPGHTAVIYGNDNIKGSAWKFQRTP